MYQIAKVKLEKAPCMYRRSLLKESLDQSLRVQPPFVLCSSGTGAGQ